MTNKSIKEKRLGNWDISYMNLNLFSDSTKNYILFKLAYGETFDYSYYFEAILFNRYVYIRKRPKANDD